MNYHAYQAHSDLMAQMRLFNEMSSTLMSHPWLKERRAVRKLTAAYDVFSSAEITHTRPDFDITSVTIGEGDDAREVAVHEVNAHVAAFGTLVHFKKAGGEDIRDQPRVLIVAPLSGHFATLLRETIRTVLPDHDVYITDWHNARDVPVSAGRFGLDEYVQYIIDFMEVIGPGAHIMAICQPCVSALVAAAVMAEDDNPAQPRSLTLMAGPIDCRINPTGVNQLATSKPHEWFEAKLINTVPSRFAGASRRVYPGYLQLSAFLSMNLQRHIESFKGLYKNLAEGGDPEKAHTTRAFYREYFAVLDLAAEFYLETIQHVFQDYSLPRGKMEWKGRAVNLAAIRRTALLTVEGERDDICGIGQTMAAQDLCTGIRPYLKLHHMQLGVGHYGVFSGRRWKQQVYPLVREMIHENT